jgi:hypothetical protein
MDSCGGMADAKYGGSDDAARRGSRTIGLTLLFRHGRAIRSTSTWKAASGKTLRLSGPEVAPRSSGRLPELDTEVQHQGNGPGADHGEAQMNRTVLILAGALLVPDERTLDQWGQWFERVAATHGGEYDGWEASVEKK